MVRRLPASAAVFYGLSRTGVSFSDAFESFSGHGFLSAAACSIVIATQNGPASVIAEMQSMLTTFLPGRGFFHIVR